MYVKAILLKGKPVFIEFATCKTIDEVRFWLNQSARFITVGE